MCRLNGLPDFPLLVGTCLWLTQEISSLDQAVDSEKLQPVRINVLETLSDHEGPTHYYTPRFLPQLRLESSSPVDSTHFGCHPLTACRLLCLVLLAVRSCPAACVEHLRLFFLVPGRLSPLSVFVVEVEKPQDL